MTTTHDQRDPPAPLAGIRIISAEQFGAGPWATMMLADLGAEIIKIENPETGGDISRYVPPYTGHRDSVYFQSWNRNKKSMALNLKHEKGAELLHGLVKGSDGVFNNLRGDLPVSLGLDYPALSPFNPRIVCCSLSAFGRSGERAGEPGYDYLMQGYAGWMSITGEPDGPPQKAGLSLVDMSAGTMAALAMMSAILRARETGCGCDVDVSLFDTALAQLSYVGAWHLTRGYQPQRMADSSHPSQLPSQVLPTADGWMVVFCAKEKFFRSLVTVMGAPEMADDPRFSSFETRLQNRVALSDALKQMSQAKSTDEWLDLLKGRVPCAPVNSVEQAFADPQVDRDEMVWELPHPEFGVVRVVGNPMKFSDFEHPRKRGPELGEQTDDILRAELGLSDDDIAVLRSEGVVS